MQSLKIDNSKYNIGLNEVDGLEAAIKKAMKPFLDCLQSKVYWTELELEQVEYLRRDGFIPHSHNCGGLELTLQIPKCEESDFQFLEFGEYENRDDNGDENRDGELDAYMRIRFKFEGLDEKNRMKFYLFLEGGNKDAPYFRDLPTIFETEFTAINLFEIVSKSKKHITKLIKIMG